MSIFLPIRARGLGFRYNGFIFMTRNVNRLNAGIVEALPSRLLGYEFLKPIEATLPLEEQFRRVMRRADEREETMLEATVFLGLAKRLTLDVIELNSHFFEGNISCRLGLDVEGNDELYVSVEMPANRGRITDTLRFTLPTPYTGLAGILHSKIGRKRRGKRDDKIWFGKRAIYHTGEFSRVFQTDEVKVKTEILPLLYIRDESGHYIPGEPTRIEQTMELDLEELGRWNVKYTFRDVGMMERGWVFGTWPYQKTPFAVDLSINDMVNRRKREVGFDYDFDKVDTNFLVVDRIRPQANEAVVIRENPELGEQIVYNSAFISDLKRIIPVSVDASRVLFNLARGEPALYFRGSG